MKNTILKICACFMILGLISGCGQKEFDENAVRENTSKKIKEEKTVEDFKITNAKIEFDPTAGSDGTTKFVADATNISDKDIKISGFNVIVKDKEGKQIVSLLIEMFDEIKSGETFKLSSYCSIDLSDAYDYEVTINK